ncbi:Trm112 family protein [Gilliamella sp. ESL0250]|uniref:Trm112 family protein n=1 Tax=Gilliamella sp. ESL0250 TaxID=2705036 RepID=UPI0015812661|nr:Trm112 family protein [Gilliamella sp. ESL0250]NUF48506.1 Trm112 family protein [Gilliamella sp. ESL0250]
MKEILLSALACPKCHGQLQYDANNQQLICQADNLVYAIKDNIPVLLESEAKPLNQSQPVQE